MDARFMQLHMVRCRSLHRTNDPNGLKNRMVKECAHDHVAKTRKIKQAVHYARIAANRSPREVRKMSSR
jgi:hypothetical protein